MTDVTAPASNTGQKVEEVKKTNETAPKTEQVSAEATPPANESQQKNSGQQRNRNGNRQNRRPGRRNGGQGQSTRATQRMLAAIASKSQVVNDESAQQFSSISPTIQLKSHTLIRYLTSEVNNIMDHAAAVIPFIQVTQRHAETRGKFDEFTEESLGLVKEVCKTNQEMIDILTQEDVRIAQRIESITMSDPREFQLVFLNEFFWDYIVMMQEADVVLHQVEKIILTGIYTEEMEQVRTDIINSVRNAFRALEFVSKLRTRRDGTAPIKLDQFRKIQTNFRTRMSTIVGDEVETEKPEQSEDQQAEPIPA